MKKVYLRLALLIVLCLVFSSVLAACEQPVEESKELEFTSYEDGTCYVSSIGTCEDEIIVIPTESPDGEAVVAIGDYAFSGCDGIKAVRIPDCVKTVGRGAFEDCDALTGVDLGKGVTKIGEYAFGACRGLLAVELPASLKALEHGAFYECGALKDVSFANGSAVEKIEYGTFYGCESLTKVTLGEKITTIGEYAFEDCSALTDIIFPTSLKKIEKRAFADCLSLAAINLPDSVEQLGDSVFYGCDGVESVSVGFSGEKKSGGTALFGYIFGVSNYNKNADLFPKSLKNVEIRGGDKIAFGSFYGSSIESLTLPHIDSISNIPVYKDRVVKAQFGALFGSESYSDNARYVPASLASLVINGGDSIGFGSFYGTKLVNLTIPHADKITDYDGKAQFGALCGSFDYLRNASAVPATLKTLVINGGDSIGFGSFYGTNLVSLTLPHVDSISSIPADKGETVDIQFGALFGASSYTENGRYIPASLANLVINGGDSIGFGSFFGTNIESFTLPFVGASHEGAGDNTYFGYYYASPNYLENISHVPMCVKSVRILGESGIPAYSFYDCEFIEKMTVDGGAVGDYAFYHCNRLASVKLGKTVSAIGESAFEFARALSSISVPGSVKSIGRYAFAECSALSSVSFSGGLVSIGEAAFIRSAIKDASLPASVSTVGASAFAYCYALRSANLGGIKRVEKDLFFNCHALEGATLPSGLTYIGDGAFYACEMLQGVKIPGGVTEIGAEAFAYCDRFVIDALPVGIKRVGESAFANCYRITSIVIPEGISEIGEYAFYGCVKLVEVVNNSALTVNIGEETNGSVALYALDVHSGASRIVVQKDFLFFTHGDVNYLIGYKPDITSSRSLTLPENYDGSKYEVYKYALLGREDVISLTVPKSVAGVGFSAFGGCTNLASLTLYSIGSGDQGYLGYFFGAEDHNENAAYVPASLKTLTFGGDKVGMHSLYGCASITKLILDEGVGLVESYAFSGCTSLETVFIPKSLSTVNEDAFENCPSISEVYYLGAKSEWSRISIDSGNNALKGAAIYYYSENQPTDKINRYWHYVDGKVTIWVVE